MKCPVSSLRRLRSLKPRRLINHHEASETDLRLLRIQRHTMILRYD